MLPAARTTRSDITQWAISSRVEFAGLTKCELINRRTFSSRKNSFDALVVVAECNPMEAGLLSLLAKVKIRRHRAFTLSGPFLEISENASKTLQGGYALAVVAQFNRM